MSQPYKKQHYVPVAYLQQFAADRSNISRKSQVWRFDGKESKLVAAETQCYENYFYSKGQAVEAEKMFQAGERSFPECVRSVMAGKCPTKLQFFGLIGTIFDLHLRNAAYENFTSCEHAAT